jgi:hypothetical protein
MSDELCKMNKPRGKPFQKGDSRRCANPKQKKELTLDVLKSHGLDDQYLLDKCKQHIDSGDSKILELVMSYRFGKPVQRNEHSGDLNINIIADKLREARERSKQRSS